MVTYARATTLVDVNAAAEVPATAAVASAAVASATAAAPAATSSAATHDDEKVIVVSN